MSRINPKAIDKPIELQLNAFRSFQYCCCRCCRVVETGESGDLVPKRNSAIPRLGASFPCRDGASCSSASDFPSSSTHLHPALPRRVVLASSSPLLFPSFPPFGPLPGIRSVHPDYLRPGPRSSLSAEARQKTLVAISISPLPPSPIVTLARWKTALRSPAVLLMMCTI